MMTLYRRRDCPRCSGIEDSLEDLALAYEVVKVDSKEDLPEDLGEGRSLPLMVDGEEVIEGSENIVKHLDEMEDYKSEWYKFGSDACYCESDTGEIA